MSNNAAVADLDADGTGGGEMGRAQWLQALACGIAPSVHMNPVLLKPQSHTGSQVIVQGKMTGFRQGAGIFHVKAKADGSGVGELSQNCNGRRSGSG